MKQSYLLARQFATRPSTLDSQIKEVFSALPIDALLELCKTFQARLLSDSTLIENKNTSELVTQADRQVQLCLLEYFRTSTLAGTYTVKAEETLSPNDRVLFSGAEAYQLIIDPLDGTNSFCKGDETWGVMIGLCNQDGQLIYSWNLLSNGEIYSSTSSATKLPPSEWTAALQSNNLLKIDIYDYGGVSAEKFPEIFQKYFKDNITREQLNITSFPAAVWAGWELYNENLNGLLWLPSNSGKGHYPDYDLSFLGALQTQGWKIALGKRDTTNHMVAIAPTEHQLSILWEIGLLMSGTSFECDRQLHTTTPQLKK